MPTTTPRFAFDELPLPGNVSVELAGPPGQKFALALPILRGGALQWVTCRIAAAGKWLLTSVTCRFQFGPVEWLWRSLTYWHRSPCGSHRTGTLQ